MMVHIRKESYLMKVQIKSKFWIGNSVTNSLWFSRTIDIKKAESIVLLNLSKLVSSDRSQPDYHQRKRNVNQQHEAVHNLRSYLNRHFQIESRNISIKQPLKCLKLRRKVFHHCSADLLRFETGKRAEAIWKNSSRNRWVLLMTSLYCPLNKPMKSSVTLNKRYGLRKASLASLLK
jgi:ribosomal protein L31E